MRRQIFDRAKGRARFEQLVDDYATWSAWKRLFLVSCVCLGVIALPYGTYSKGEIDIGWKAIGLGHKVSVSENPVLFAVIVCLAEALLLFSLYGWIRMHLAYRSRSKSKSLSE